LLEVGEQFQDAWAEGFDECLIAAAGKVFLELEDEPHGPVGDEHAVVMIAGITHGQHAVREVVETNGALVILEEVVFDRGIAAEVGGDAGGEVTITEPTGAFAGGAVHEHVGGVLAERFTGGFEDAVEALIAGAEFGAGGIGIDEFAEVDIAQLAIALEDAEFEVAQGIGFERLEPVGAGLEFVEDDVYAGEAFEVDVAVGEDFVEREEEAGGGMDLDFEAEEAAKARSEVQDAAGVGWQVEGQFAGGGLEGDGGDRLEFEGGDGFQFGLGESAQGGSDAGEGAVFPGRGRWRA